MSANATPRKLEALTIFGYNLGLAFQVIDDILDVTQTTEVLGKTAGKDEAVDKSTYPAVLGLEASRKEAARLTRKALSALVFLVARANVLSRLAAICWSVSIDISGLSSGLSHRLSGCLRQSGLQISIRMGSIPALACELVDGHGVTS